MDGQALGSTNVPHSTTTDSYDSYGRVTSQTVTSNDGSGGGNPTTIVSTTSYIQNDTVSATSSGVTGYYLVNFPGFTTVQNSGGTRASCTAYGYDGGPAGNLGQRSGLTKGEATSVVAYATSCVNGSLAGPLTTTTHYDSYGNAEATTDADANGSISGHTGCTEPDSGSTLYTSCQTYDGTYKALPTNSSNALNQSGSIGYGSSTSASTGFGLWPISSTDVNGQTTALGYDALGRTTSQTLPGETSGETTNTKTYTIFCSGSTSAQAPCIEVDTTARVDSNDTVTSRSFYDGEGHLIETRDQGPSGQDVVQYSEYDPSGRVTFQSIPYFVTAYTGGPGAAAFSTPDANQPGTMYTRYDGMGRLTNMSNALSHQTITGYSVECGAAGDSGCYEQQTTTDALLHQSLTLTDAIGREDYTQSFTGTNPYYVYATTAAQYDLNGRLVKVTRPDTKTITFTYDLAGRETGMSDPDWGAESYSYDPNGNMTELVDARGLTTFAGYDGLNRQLWRNTTNSPSNAYVTYVYDSTLGGNQGIGRLTGELFDNANAQASLALTGSYSYVYDARGRITSSTISVNGTPYTSSATYNDADQMLTQTYPDGDVVTTGYTGQGWFGSLSVTPNGGSAVSLFSNVTYTGVMGATGNPTGGVLNGGTYTYSASEDALLRPTDTRITLTSNGSRLFDVQPTYDSVNNVIGVATTLPQGTDNQAFCYDALERLNWAGASGNPPCGGSITQGTLTSANYSQTFSLGTLNQLLTTGSGHTYTYGNSSHPDAVASIASGYTAAYDAAGNMTCRAPTSSQTCAGPPQNFTGQHPRWDNEGRMVTWANSYSNPTSNATYLYDGEGNRVEQVVQNSTGTTDTSYLGNEEITTITPTGGGNPETTTTAYYDSIALSVNGTLSYLGTDPLGSGEVALTTSGGVLASRLYTPYGNSRYSSGVFPTEYGFTGYLADSASGLNYAHARYYDPVAGQFISADATLAGGENRYAYVGGNPETVTDSSGNCPWCIAAAVGFVLGAAISYGTQVAQNVAKGGSLTSTSTWTDVNWGQVVAGAVIGGIVGLTGGLAGIGLEAGIGAAELTGPAATVATVVGTAAIGAGEGALGQIGSNLASGQNWSNGLGQAAVIGVIAAGIDVVPGDGTGEAGGGDTGGAGGGDGEGGGASCGESFAPTTLVATPHGEHAISSLTVGTQVVAYNPATKHSSTQTVQHVFIDHDTDLLDVTLRITPMRGPPTSQHSQHGQSAKHTTHNETVHTTASHPWLSADRGWVRAGALHLGEQVMRADGMIATVVGLRVVPGAADMWDLTVSHLHTFVVGAGQFVVHNCAAGGGNPPSTNDLIDRGEEAAASAGRRGGVGVYAEGPGGDVVLDSSFTSSSVDQSGGHFQGIINDAIQNGSNVAGKCAEVGACAELYNHAGDLDGGYVDMGLWQNDGQPPCDTCQKILQQTANDLNITINIQDGIHELDPFEPEGW